MAVQVQNFPKKNISQPSIQPMPHFPFTTTAWWNSQEEQFHRPLSKSLSLKVGSPPRACQGREACMSSSTTRPGLIRLGDCISSDSAQDKSYRKHVEGQVKPVLFLPNPSFEVNPSQVDINPSMAHIPYTYRDPYVNGLYTAYGPQAIASAVKSIIYVLHYLQIRPSVVGIAPARVLLPIELAEDGPIYVNAKHYHGILGRRQIRARPEAQNKLLKNRKPYLHQYRHRHALNKVRGSGGRFLSTKKLKPSNPTPRGNSDIDSDSVNQSETGKHEASSTSPSITHVNKNDVYFQQADHRFSNGRKSGAYAQLNSASLSSCPVKEKQMTTSLAGSSSGKTNDHITGWQFILGFVTLTLNV